MQLVEVEVGEVVEPLVVVPGDELGPVGVRGLRERPDAVGDVGGHQCVVLAAVRGLLVPPEAVDLRKGDELAGDRKSTRLNSSHVEISYAVFCLKKKKKKKSRE